MSLALIALSHKIIKLLILAVHVLLLFKFNFISFSTVMGSRPKILQKILMRNLQAFLYIGNFTVHSYNKRHEIVSILDNNLYRRVL